MLEFGLWLLSNLAIYWGVVSVHYLAGGDWFIAAVTILVALEIIAAVSAIYVIKDIGTVKAYKIMPRLKPWNYFEIIWIVPVLFVGEYGLAVAQLIKYAAFCWWAIAINSKDAEFLGRDG